MSIKTIPNFRVLGAHMEVKEPLLYRSGNPSKVSIDEALFLKEKGIKTYIDLRSDKEIKLDGRPINLIKVGINWVHLPIQGYHSYFDTIKLPSINDYVNYYKAILIASKKMTRNFVEYVINSSEKLPLIFGCSAGKDRTGVLSAILLLVMGEEYKSIVQDYALTSKYLLPRIDEFEDIWKKKGLSKVDYMKRIDTKRETMQIFLQFLLKEFGTIENYFDAIGIKEKEFLIFKYKIIKGKDGYI